jgi:hypothetical protein
LQTHSMRVEDMRSLHWILAVAIAIFGLGSFVRGMEAPIGEGLFVPATGSFVLVLQWRPR